MCTVSYLPVDKEQFILTANRDESPERPTESRIQEHRINGKSILFPQDLRAKGSWIASSSEHSACLLNGAFLKHHRRDSYRRSRGLMLLDFFEEEQIDEFHRKYDFNGIEAFTLILIRHRNRSLVELRWDEKELHYRVMDDSIPCIWSSATLYTQKEQQLREDWFKQWLASQSSFSADAIKAFHHFGGKGDMSNDLLMRRQSVQTLSISCIERTASGLNFYYEDLISNQQSISRITA